MYTFDSEDLFIGYLKQLLASFNLPKYKVYTAKDAKYNKIALEHNKKIDDGEIIGYKWPEEAPNILASDIKGSNDTRIQYINYIKKNVIQRYVNKQWKETRWHYHYNKKELNQTRNLVVKNNIYDSYTHEYLGEYLRFQRDYNNIDLMPLYNCFSNVICQVWKNPININKTTTIDGIQQVKNIATFDPSDKAYKIYALPVKLFQKYTIAIDSEKPVEICCGFYNKYMDNMTELVLNFQTATYTKYNSMQFSEKVVYDKLYVPNEIEKAKFGIDSWALQGLDLNELAQKEHNLKMFIKVAASNNSTIVVLEGDYSGYGDYVVNNTRSKFDPFYKSINNAAWTKHENKYITNYETSTIGEKYILTDDSSDDDPSIDDNYIEIPVPAISERDFNPITSLQLLKLNTTIQHPFADRLVEYLLDNVVTPEDEISDNIQRAQHILVMNNIQTTENGIWYPEYRNIFYDYMHLDYKIEPIYEQSLSDSLGYIDKDVEKYYAAWKTDIWHNANGEPEVIGEIAVTKLLKVTDNNEDKVLGANSSILLGINSNPGEEINIPIYKTVNTKLGTIANADIYPDMYKDSKNK